MTSTERQQIIPGTGPCGHPDGSLEEIKNGAEQTIGMRCRACGLLMGKAWCAGCNHERWCTVVVVENDERFCTVDCREQTAARRSKMGFLAREKDRLSRRGPHR